MLADPADPDAPKVLTGHDAGLITLNIAEADDAERESRRHGMHEVYRTLLGHFRHEVGHYYWDRLVRDGGQAVLDQYRELFGDERQGYAQALQRHYDQGPPADWPEHHISAYASTHPWEDFAETWAHYLHIVDTLGTASVYGLALHPGGSQDGVLVTPPDFDAYKADSIETLIAAWTPLSLAVNSLNRSMGQPDLYPFVLSPAVVTKLGYVHELVRSAGRVAERGANGKLNGFGRHAAA
jgi:hypothetical protein